MLFSLHSHSSLNSHTSRCYHWLYGPIKIIATEGVRISSMISDLSLAFLSYFHVISTDRIEFLQNVQLKDVANKY